MPPAGTPQPFVTPKRLVRRAQAPSTARPCSADFGATVTAASIVRVDIRAGRGFRRDRVQDSRRSG
jgi:hypothetical protein